MKVLITGGAGYVGATIASACTDAGHESVVLDDLSRGARAFATRHPHYCGDIADSSVLRRIFSEHPDIAAVVHCAAAIVVPESVEQPLHYYRNNVAKTVELLATLGHFGCRRVLFSSSASIYAATDDLTVDESSSVRPTSPYASTKAMVEQVLRDAAAAGAVDAIALRYFNPVGADPQLRTGLQVPQPTHAWGRLIKAYETGEPFTITGTDWPTRDGTGIRDYVHVWDIARVHVRALERFDAVLPSGGFDVINVGTGTGTTVRELVRAFEAAVGSTLLVREAPRRPGDAIGCYARVDKAKRVLGWRAELSIAQAFRDGLAWAQIRDRVLAG
jgi:UDP-glucose 4-epimerase